MKNPDEVVKDIYVKQTKQEIKNEKPREEQKISLIDVESIEPTVSAQLMRGYKRMLNEDMLLRPQEIKRAEKELLEIFEIRTRKFYAEEGRLYKLSFQQLINERENRQKLLENKRIEKKEKIKHPRRTEENKKGKKPMWQLSFKGKPKG